MSRIQPLTLRHLVFAIVLVAALSSASPAASASPQEWRFSGVERVVAVGDVHGAYDALVDLLHEVGVLSSDLEWSGGSTWLIMLGDLVDRGTDSRDVLDLVMHLQQGAPKAGGRVLIVLGNHDVMYMLGQLLYASDGDYSTFANDETTRIRKRAHKRYVERARQQQGPLLTRSEFDRSNPPGTFAFRKAFSIEGKYGRWLLDQHILIVVDATAYVHGGLPPDLAEYHPDEINRVALDELRTIMEAQKVLVDSNVFGAETDFDEQLRPAELYIQRWHESQKKKVLRRLEAARTVSQMSSALAVSSTGPLWYRGTYRNPQYREDRRVSAILAHLGATRVVMGHTPSDDGTIQIRLDGRAVMADTGMLASEYSGQASAVIVADGGLFAFYPGQDLVPLPDPAQRQIIDRNITRAWEEALMTGELLSMDKYGTQTPRSRRLVLVHEKRLLRAVYTTGDMEAEKNGTTGLDRYQHELAAYQVDQLLGFGLVPPTVMRRIGDEVGSLQLRPDNNSEADHRSKSTGPAADSLSSEREARIQVFDCLIHNPNRVSSSILWNQEDGAPLLTDHGSAFAAVALASTCPTVAALDDATAASLRSLEAERLRRTLHDLLSEAQLEALINRLDELFQPSRVGSGE